MKTLPLVILLCLIMSSAFCSDTTTTSLKKNVVFALFGGKENFGSINYERIFTTGRSINVSASVGVQPWQFSKKFSVPVSINFFTAGRMHHLELDAAATFYMDKYHQFNGGYKSDYNKQLYLSPFVCYRYQKSSGLVFKTGAGPQLLIDPPSNGIANTHTQVLGPAVFGSLGLSF